jgi:hypothetical protein
MHLKTALRAYGLLAGTSLFDQLVAAHEQRGQDYLTWSKYVWPEHEQFNELFALCATLGEVKREFGVSGLFSTCINEFEVQDRLIEITLRVRRQRTVVDGERPIFRIENNGHILVGRLRFDLPDPVATLMAALKEVVHAS